MLLNLCMPTSHACTLSLSLIDVKAMVSTAFSATRHHFLHEV